MAFYVQMLLDVVLNVHSYDHIDDVDDADDDQHVVVVVAVVALSDNHSLQHVVTWFVVVAVKKLVSREKQVFVERHTAVELEL